jgi:ATP-dependent DNA helicase RecG
MNKEAVVNALVHRDYSFQIQNAYVSVTMFADRIEITNPGVLYGTNKIEKFGSSNSMESILEKLHTILENRHTGIPTIIRKMKKGELPEPEFVEESDCFKVILKNGVNESDDLSSKPVIKKSGHEEKQSLKHSQKISKVHNHKSNVLLFCNEPKNMNEIMEILGLNSRSYVRENIIAPLLKDGCLQFVYPNIKSKTQKYVTSKINKDGK